MHLHFLSLVFCADPYTSATGLPPCDQCPKGYYFVNHTTCERCPDGTSTVNPGAHVRDQCLGKHVISVAGTKCLGQSLGVLLLEPNPKR